MENMRAAGEIYKLIETIKAAALGKTQGDGLDEARREFIERGKGGHIADFYAWGAYADTCHYFAEALKEYEPPAALYMALLRAHEGLCFSLLRGLASEKAKALEEAFSTTTLFAMECFKDTGKAARVFGADTIEGVKVAEEQLEALGDDIAAATDEGIPTAEMILLM